MDAIAACFIGGTAVTGGIGTIPGAVVGAFVMGVINQGLSIMGVDTAIVNAMMYWEIHSEFEHILMIAFY